MLSNRLEFCPDQSTDELYKLPRLNAKDSWESNGHSITKDGDDEDDDVAAGPELPPDLEEEALDDEEGRFFGGGITNVTAEVLDFIEGRDKDDLTVRFLRSAV